MHARHLLPALFVLVFVAALLRPLFDAPVTPEDPVSATAIVTTDRTTDQAEEITAAMFEGVWPFTLPSGTLRCQTERLADLTTPVQVITFTTPDGEEYAVNGAARSEARGYADMTGVTRPDTSVAAVIEYGLSLCAR